MPETSKRMVKSGERLDVVSILLQAVVKWRRFFVMGKKLKVDSVFFDKRLEELASNPEFRELLAELAELGKYASPTPALDIVKVLNLASEMAKFFPADHRWHYEQLLKQLALNVWKDGLDVPEEKAELVIEAQSEPPAEAKENGLKSWERYTNEKQTGWEGEIWSGETFTPRSIACHGLPSNPYEYSLMEPPNWEWKPQHFLDIMTKVKSLKAKAPPLSELQQRYNDITAKGRQMVFEKEIEWLWGSDISTLMKPPDLTEEDMVISNRTREHEENERMNKARAAAGKWIDPPELESPPEFWARQGSLAARSQAGEMHREQETRKLWLKVYEELAGLYETIAGALLTTPASGQAGFSEISKELKKIINRTDMDRLKEEFHDLWGQRMPVDRLRLQLAPYGFYVFERYEDDYVEHQRGEVLFFPIPTGDPQTEVMFKIFKDRSQNRFFDKIARGFPESELTKFFNEFVQAAGRNGPEIIGGDNELLTARAPEWKPQLFLTNTDPSEMPPIPPDVKSSIEVLQNWASQKDNKVASQPFTSAPGLADRRLTKEQATELMNKGRLRKGHKNVDGVYNGVAIVNNLKVAYADYLERQLDDGRTRWGEGIISEHSRVSEDTVSRCLEAWLAKGVCFIDDVPLHYKYIENNC